MMRKSERSENSFRAVIFDMDGLMIDTEPIYMASWQRAASAAGYDLTDEIYMNLVGMNDSDAEQILVDIFGNGFPLVFFKRLWQELWHEEVTKSGVAVKPGLRETLKFLDSKEVPYAVATSTKSDLAERSLLAANLAGRFSVMVTGEQVPRGKPAPDIYLMAARIMGVEAKFCIVLEDSDAGIISAASAGMTAIMIPDLKPPSPEAQAAAYEIFPSLMDARPEIIKLFSRTDTG